MTKEVKQAKAVELPSHLKELQQKVDTRAEYTKIVDRFIKTQLKEGTDYGAIEMDRKKRDGTPYKVTSKPTLFKAGAEKFADLFETRPEWQKDEDTWEMLGRMSGVVCYLCFLRNKEGQSVGEGRGTAHTTMGSDFDINKQVKIAKKRAFVDAVLTAFSLSERFTQDFDDVEEGDTPKTKVQREGEIKKVVTEKPNEDEKLIAIRPAINALNMAKTPEQVDQLLAGLVKSEKYKGKEMYDIKQHADNRKVALRKVGQK